MTSATWIDAADGSCASGAVASRKSQVASSVAFGDGIGHRPLGIYCAFGTDSIKKERCKATQIETPHSSLLTPHSLSLRIGVSYA